jgi:hypothetical protein
LIRGALHARWLALVAPVAEGGRPGLFCVPYPGRGPSDHPDIEPDGLDETTVADSLAGLWTPAFPSPSSSTQRPRCCREPRRARDPRRGTTMGADRRTWHLRGRLPRPGTPRVHRGTGPRGTCERCRGAAVAAHIAGGEWPKPDSADGDHVVVAQEQGEHGPAAVRAGLHPALRLGPVTAMVTPTYRGDWLTVVPSGADLKRHLKALRKRYAAAPARRCGCDGGRAAQVGGPARRPVSAPFRAGDHETTPLPTATPACSACSLLFAWIELVKVPTPRYKVGKGPDGHAGQDAARGGQEDALVRA